MSETKGKINTYTCRRCGWRAVTRNRDTGTTPFLIHCEGPLRCDDGRWPGCESGFYRVNQSLEPTHEWYRPISAGERKALKDVLVAEHVKMGGLLLRRVFVH